MQVITERKLWQECLAGIGEYDFYHTYDYHLSDTAARDGRPVLFYFEAGSSAIALPLIVRPCPAEGAGAGEMFDATSVYGYSGAISSAARVPDEAVSAFQHALIGALNDLRVISVFSRLHPLIGNRDVLGGLGRTESCGRTVGIDLRIPEDEQWRAYSKNKRWNIRKLAQKGVVCEMSHSPDDLDRFVEMYFESMERVNASSEYFFDQAYFETITGARDYDMKLFVCNLDSTVICGGLFSSSNGIIQYHLGATDNEFLSLAPTELLFDTVRKWGCQTGHTWLHLGGGVGGGEDSLYKFKARFSKLSFPFYIWKWVVDPDSYSRLVTKGSGSGANSSDSIDYDGYFPAYRAR